MTENHPVPEALRAARAALESITVRDGRGRVQGWVGFEGMTAAELQEVVRLQAELEGRIAGLRLAAVAAADSAHAFEETAAVDTKSWAAKAGVNRARSWGGVWLGNLLEEKYHHVRAALATGRISEEHASIIVRAAEKVPGRVAAGDLAECESRMVEKASTMNPQRLRRAVRRLVEPLSRELADQHEHDLLREEEHRAEKETWLVLGDNGDGTWSGRFTIPELHGHALKHYLEKVSAPRRQGRNKAGEPVEDPSVPGVGIGFNYTEGMGQAFLEMIEHLPEDGQGRSSFQLVVHIDEEKLRNGLGAATLASGTTVSTGEARRLACEAGLLPLVLSGRSLKIHDIGMSMRLFSRAQAIALSAIYDSCAAEGCDRPFAWCELHHRIPFSEGGPTDLENAVPLCGYHHRRVHDERYEHQWLADGSVRFRHRWPSRWKNGTDPWSQNCSAA